MKILFIHGLESTLNEPKKSVLEKYGEVLAPILDYKNNANIYSLLESIIEENEVDVLIGISIGGFMGYYLNKNLNKPALLFNPALPYQSVKQVITTKNEVIQKPLKILMKKIIVKYSKEKPNEII